jgi:predicted nucleic acid-binding protein
MADGAPWRGQVGARCPSSTHGIAPTIVQQELAQWTVRELGELGEDEADPVVTCTQKCQVLALDTALALLAACLRRDHNLATADAIVSASALHTGARPI